MSTTKRYQPGTHATPEYQREYRRKRLANGICPKCGKPNPTKKCLCPECLMLACLKAAIERSNRTPEQQEAYRAKQREYHYKSGGKKRTHLTGTTIQERLAYYRLKYQFNKLEKKCPRCGKQAKKYVYCNSCLIKRRVQGKRHREKIKRLKEERLARKEST